MRVLLAAFAVLFLAFLVGCGGSTVSDGTTDGTTSGSLRAPAGDYTAAMAGTQTSGGSVTGTGSGNSASDGTISLTYSQTDGGGTTARTISASVTTAGVASGTILVGGTSALPFSGGTLARNSDGTFLLTVSTVTGSGETAITETDRFTLTAVRPAAGLFAGVVSGSDNRGGTYTGTGSFSLASNGGFTLSYSSHRSLAGVGTTQAHTLPSTLLSDGTFSGTMTVGISASVAITGTWVSNSDGTVTLTLNYDNTTYFPTPTVAETIVLTRQ